jgi:NifB/MoaA-like Fe-S oxidoreductase
MRGTVEGEARKALARFRRALEKVDRELEALAGSLRHAEAEDFPAERFDEASSHLGALHEFAEEQAERLEEKLLVAGGLEPGRIRRRGG